MIQSLNISPAIAPFLEENWAHKLLTISRVTDFDEAAALKLAAEIAYSNTTPSDKILVVVDSFGGEVYALNSMIASFKMTSKPILTFAQGKAMSCGAILAGMGTVGHRYVAPNTTIMLHPIFGGYSGNPDELEAGSKHLKHLSKSILQELALHCGHTDKDYFIDLLRANNNAELFLTAKQAKKHKLVDRISLPKVDISLELKIDIG